MSYKTHGFSTNDKTGTYGSWNSMIGRCYRPAESNYHRYGERGITVCDRWRTFANFLADMGVKPKGLTLDRINNDGNYEPSNCRWATIKENSSNTSRTIRVTYKGKTQCLKDWAAELNVPYRHLGYRIRNGIPFKDALKQMQSSNRLSHYSIKVSV